MKKSITQKMSKSFEKKISYANILFCVAFFCLFSTTALSKNKSEILLDKHQDQISQIENYLNNLKNLSANFTQNAGKNLTKGKFYLSRPGKLRIEYSEKPKVIIIANGSVLTYEDVELEEISNLRTNTTPVSFLTRKNISFSAKDVELTAVKDFKKTIKISVMKKNRKEAGEFSLIFNKYPLEFIKMEVKNDLDQIVSVTLNNTNFEAKIPRKLFVVKNKILP